MNKAIALSIFDIRRIIQDRRIVYTIFTNLISIIALFLIALPFILNLQNDSIVSRTPKVYINYDQSNKKFEEFIVSQGNFNILKSDDLKRDVLEHEASAGLEIRKNKNAVSFVIYRNTFNISSVSASNSLANIIQDYKVSILSGKTCEIVDQICEIAKAPILQDVPYEKNAKLGFLAFVVPFILISSAIAGAQVFAIDGLNGDIERKSFNLILMLPIAKSQIVASKILSIFIISITSFVFTIILMLVTPAINILIKQLFIRPGTLLSPSIYDLTAQSLLYLAAYGIMISMLISAIYITISIYSDSVKQGNMIGYFIQSLLALMSGSPQMISLQYWYFIPVINIPYGLVNIFENSLNYKDLTLSIATNLFLSISIVIYSFKRFKSKYFS